MTFFTWRSAVLNSDLPATTKLVLMVIGTHMNDHGEGAFPSTKTIAKLASLSERAVCTHTEKAEKAGWLKKDLHGFRGQKWKRVDYKISFPGDEAAEPHSAPLGTEGTEPSSAPEQKGTEPHAEGTEPHDRKALNEVQSITPYNSPYNSPVIGADAPPAKKSKARKCELPGDFTLTAERGRKAADYWQSKNRSDLDVRDEFESFRNHHTQHGKEMACWESAWQTWYTNAVKFNRAPVQQFKTAQQQRAERNAEIFDFEKATRF